MTSEAYQKAGRPGTTTGGVMIMAISCLSALLLIAALVYAAGIGQRHTAALAAADCEPGLTPAGQQCTTQPMMAAEYRAMLAPASQQLATDAVAYAANEGDHLAVAEAALTAESAAERALGRSLAAFPFPPAIAPIAKGLIEANQTRATLTAEQARSSSLTRLRSFDHQVQLADAAVETEMKLVAAAVDAPLPGALGRHIDHGGSQLRTPKSLYQLKCRSYCAVITSKPHPARWQGWGAEMADNSAWSRAGARRPEPSWPTVIATTIRLWVSRHPVAGLKITGWRLLALVACAVLAISAAVAAVVVGTTATATTASSPARPPIQAGSAGSQISVSLQAATAARASAAGWIAGQVSPNAIVACDPAMCAALQVSGVAAGRLLMLGTSASDPLGSDLVVATPALRSQFGARLASVYAPAVIASFGSGAARIDIRAVAADGTAAYDSALTADRSARIAAGEQLIGNRNIAMTAAARAVLRAGQVDPRLLATLAVLAAQQPLRILAFGDPSPGVSAAIPLRSVELAPDKAGTHAAARLRTMLSFLQAQQPPFLPTTAALVHQSALSVEYAAPSPLGLLSGN